MVSGIGLAIKKDWTRLLYTITINIMENIIFGMLMETQLLQGTIITD